jgi:hypothetical protein
MSRLSQFAKTKLPRIWKNGTSHLLAWVSRHRVGTRSIAWFTLSIVAFGLAARFTWDIAHVSKALDALASPGTILAENSGWYVFTVLAAPKGMPQHPPSIGRGH